MKEAFTAYCEEVRAGTFPGREHVYNMLPGELEKLKAKLTG
jgi:ketopantoate hydroxymethyltransferase